MVQTTSSSSRNTFCNRQLNRSGNNVASVYHQRWRRMIICRFTSCVNAVGEEPTENRESRNKEPLFSQLYSQQSFSLHANVGKQPFAERSGPMSSSVSPRVDSAALTTEATASSREIKWAMRGTDIPWIHELLISSMELFHKKIRCRRRQRPTTSDHPTPRGSRTRSSPPPNAPGNGR